MKRIIPLACAILLLATCGITVQASDTDYVLDNDGIRLATPKTYLVQDVITYLGEEGGNLYEPSDIFIDKEDNITAYVVGDEMTPVTFHLGTLTDDERRILLAGCLINFYKES